MIPESNPPEPQSPGVFSPLFSLRNLLGCREAASHMGLVKTAPLQFTTQACFPRWGLSSVGAIHFGPLCLFATSGAPCISNCCAAQRKALTSISDSPGWARCIRHSPHRLATWSVSLRTFFVISVGNMKTLILLMFTNNETLEIR